MRLFWILVVGRRFVQKERTPFKGTRWLLQKNPWNLTGDQRERLSTLIRWNAPIVRAYYLKEAFQLFWFYKQPKRAKEHLEKWMRSAMSSRLEPFKKFVRMLRSHLDGILSWTNHRVSNGAVEGMNNKIKSDQPSLLWISYRRELHRGHLSLLRSPAAARRTLIALLGYEPRGSKLLDIANRCPVHRTLTSKSVIVTRAV